MNKIALALIVKGTDTEAVLLDRCLENVKPYVDGIFVTSTYKKGEQPNKTVEKIASTHGASLSTFEWCNDFSKARNFNFSQVTKDYDYILWCDADDMWRGLDKLKDIIKENPQTDAFSFWYLYEFDAEKMPTVVHKKTMLVKNDGCCEWKGALHEDLCPTRMIDNKFVEGIDRMHFTTEERVETNRTRNIEVAKNQLALNENDPHAYFNLGNSYLGASQYEEAKDCLQKFLTMSSSVDEKYIALMRLGLIQDKLGDREGCIERYQTAIGLQPTCSDAFLQLGQLYFQYDDMDKAEEYLLQGLVRKPPYHKIIVFNPRDYDFNPMHTLAKVYFKKNRPDLALPMLKGCLQIYPNNKRLKNVVKDMEKEVKRQEKVIKLVERINEITDVDKIKKELSKVPKDLRSHPAICQIRNKYFVKTETSGKDVTYYCGVTTHEWNPVMAKDKGIGGSEEAVINLSKEWAKQGYNVTVYNNCGTEEMICDGVTYKPYWEFNPKDKTDYLIVWRHPKLLDYELNAGKVFVDMHDVIGKGEFTEKRIAKLDKIFVKTQFHKSLFPTLPDEKVAIIPNGMDFELFKNKCVCSFEKGDIFKAGMCKCIKKDPMLLVNTSSPDRSMDVLPELFMRVKEQVPEARLKWAYGWEIFDNTYSDDKQMMEWKKQIVKSMQEAGIEDMGRLSQKECAKLYLEGSFLAYPTEFAEIDCITVKKAQACNCVPVTTDFGALEESVKYGYKVHSPKTKDNWSRDFKWSFGIEDEKVKDEWVKTMVKALKEQKEFPKMKEWTLKFKWDKIATEWSKVW